MTATISTAAVADLCDRNPIEDVASRLGAVLRRQGQSLMGSCPICSRQHNRNATRFEILRGGERWACAVCQDGGDVIRLVQLAEGLNFRGAVEWLGGAQQPDPVRAAALDRDRAAKQAKREADAVKYRERERERLWRLWHSAAPPQGTLVEAYLAHRGLVLPPTKALRFLPETPYFDGKIRDDQGVERARVIYRGPAMLAAFRRPDGRFGGLHLTYLDPHMATPKGKAEIAHPDTGELVTAKKMRGSKSASVLPLVDPPTPRRLIWGEGIETVLAVFRDMPDRRPDDAFWAAGDLGNLGGPAGSNVAHPTERTPKGRATRVPSAEPSPHEPAAIIPDSVVELVILGDADSDPFLTKLAVQRCANRYKRDGRKIGVLWPRTGGDFADMLLGAT